MAPMGGPQDGTVETEGGCGGVLGMGSRNGAGGAGGGGRYGGRGGHQAQDPPMGTERGGGKLRHERANRVQCVAVPGHTRVCTRGNGADNGAGCARAGRAPAPAHCSAPAVTSLSPTTEMSPLSPQALCPCGHPPTPPTPPRAHPRVQTPPLSTQRCVCEGGGGSVASSPTHCAGRGTPIPSTPRGTKGHPHVSSPPPAPHIPGPPAQLCRPPLHQRRRNAAAPQQPCEAPTPPRPPPHSPPPTAAPRTPGHPPHTGPCGGGTSCTSRGGETCKHRSRRW